MGRAAALETAAERVVELRRAAAELPPAQRRRVAQVAEQLRGELGPSIPKTRAASLLGVSVTALEKWIARGKLPVAQRGSSRLEVDAEVLLELVEEVTRLRERGERRHLLARAFAQLDERRASVESIVEAAELIEAVSVIAEAGDET